VTVGVKRFLVFGTVAALVSFAVAAAGAAPAGAGAIRVTISSPTHHPKVNVGWPVTITVTNAAGKPVAGTLTMDVFAGAAGTYPIDSGAHYHFVGRWHEPASNLITWPVTSEGYPLAFEVIVKAQGETVRKRWAIDVVG
jgi:hypothetical protein